jgi:hypothetical protein
MNRIWTHHLNSGLKKEQTAFSVACSSVYQPTRIFDYPSTAGARRHFDMCLLCLDKNCCWIWLTLTKKFTKYWNTSSVEYSPSEKLIVAKLVKILPASYGTRRSITMFTTDHNWNLSWARWIQKRSTKGAIQIRGTVYHFVTC